MLTVAANDVSLGVKSQNLSTKCTSSITAVIDVWIFSQRKIDCKYTTIHTNKEVRNAYLVPTSYSWDDPLLCRAGSDVEKQAGTWRRR